MRTALIALMAGASLFYLLAAGTAVAETKARKPSVCQSFRLFSEQGKGPVAVCFDNKRPKVLISYSLVDVTDPETGAKRRYAVGF